MKNKTNIPAPGAVVSWLKRVDIQEKYLLLGIFMLALVLRLIYLLQISQVPFFENPVGDSKLYFERAQAILAGQWLPTKVYFHSSPVYPYFIAFCLWLFKQNIFWLYFLQCLIGAGNCVLIYLLTQRLTGGRVFPAVAGILSAFYGLLAFFDGDMLMIFMTLFFTDLALLLILKARQAQHRTYWALLAGCSLGLAILDKTNLLVFVPVAAWFLASEFYGKISTWQWKPALGFMLGVGIMLAPISLANRLTDQDWVLVSSNAGVNLYIGNNPKALGAFLLPAESGLSNLDLEESSTQGAEQAVGRKLKASEVSHYWANRAVQFILQQPLAALRITLKKLMMFCNAYEVPNHLNFYYIRQDLANSLWILIIGFWIITPLAILGIFGKWQQGFKAADKLYFSFIIVYMFSLLPFFITERYRLPVVPVFIAFAAWSLKYIWIIYHKKGQGWKIWAIPGTVLILASLIVNAPAPIYLTYAHSRVAVSGKYLERALQNPLRGEPDIIRAILGLKQALETEPLSEDARFNLARAYEAVGLYSEAIRLQEEVLRINPQRELPQKILPVLRENLKNRGDLTSLAKIPRTLYELAKQRARQGYFDLAIEKYKALLKDNPFHVNARNDLGLLYFNRKQYTQAVKVFRKGIQYDNRQFSFWNNMAGAYYKLGKTEKARTAYRKCLELQPGSPIILKQIKKLK